MAHHLLEELEFQWALLRETPNSQKFLAVFCDFLETVELQALVDVHYTRAKIANATICLIGEEGKFTKTVHHTVFRDLEKIIKRNGSYDVLDYNLVYGADLEFGNYWFM